MGKQETEALKRVPRLSRVLIGAFIVFLSQQRVHQNDLLDRALGTTLPLPAGFNPALSWVMNCPTSGPPSVLESPCLLLEEQQAQTEMVLL